MEDRLQNQMGHGEGQLKVKEEDLTRVEKTARSPHIRRDRRARIWNL